MKIKPMDKKGSVTVELGRKDDALLAGAAQPKAHPLPIRKILVPVDFSEYSYKSLDYATAFAEESGAQIILLHVVPLNYVDTDLIAFDYSELSKEAATSCENRLQKLREERIGPKLEVKTAGRIGRPVEEILAAAREWEVDLIIMSTHGYTGLKHAFLGSTTENIVRYAPCPVLTLRQHEHDFINKETSQP